MKKARIISSMRNPSFCFYRQTESYILYMINPRLEIKQSGRGFYLYPLFILTYFIWIRNHDWRNDFKRVSFQRFRQLELCGNLQPHFRKEVIKPTNNQSPDNRMHFIMPLISLFSVVKWIIKGGLKKWLNPKRRPLRSRTELRLWRKKSEENGMMFSSQLPGKAGMCDRNIRCFSAETEGVSVTLAENILQICQTTKGLFDKLFWKITF